MKKQSKPRTDSWSSPAIVTGMQDHVLQCGPDRPVFRYDAARTGIHYSPVDGGIKLTGSALVSVYYTGDKPVWVRG